MKNLTTADRVPLVGPELTIAELRKKLPELTLKSDTINYVYIVGQSGRLKGVISVKEIFRQKLEVLVGKAMEKKLIVAGLKTPALRVAHLALKNNIKSIPVLDKKGKFAGIIAGDEVTRILFDEYREHILHSVGVVPKRSMFKNILEQSLGKTLLLRLPWVIVGLFGGMLAAEVMEKYTGLLKTNLMLAAFIPLIVYINAAVGAQTQTFFVRDLAIMPRLPILSYAFKQFITSIIMGLICGAVTFLIVVFFRKDLVLVKIVTSAVVVGVGLSTLIAVSVPYLLYKLKQDPASGSGPFATILQDIFSILLYFTIAGWWL